MVIPIDKYCIYIVYIYNIYRVLLCGSTCGYDMVNARLMYSLHNKPMRIDKKKTLSIFVFFYVFIEEMRLCLKFTNSVSDLSEELN